jgi:hypothetical protein
VLEPQHVAFEFPPVHELQQVGPQLPFERDDRIGLQLLPKQAQLCIDPTIGDGVAAEFGANRQRVGRQRGFERYRAIEPGKKYFRLLRVEHGAFDDGEFPGLQLKNRPFLAIGGDPDEMLFLLALAVGKIIGHPSFNVLPFPVEIALGLENRAADQGFEPPAHFGHAALEIERAEFDAELLDEQLAEICLHLVMTGPAREMPYKINGCLRGRHRRIGRLEIAKAARRLPDLRARMTNPLS